MITPLTMRTADVSGHKHHGLALSAGGGDKIRRWVTLAVSMRARDKLERPRGLMGGVHARSRGICDIWVVYMWGSKKCRPKCLQSFLHRGTVDRSPANFRASRWLRCVAARLLVSFCAGQSRVFRDRSICWGGSERTWIRGPQKGCHCLLSDRWSALDHGGTLVFCARACGPVLFDRHRLRIFPRCTAHVRDGCVTGRMLIWPQYWNQDPQCSSQRRKFNRGDAVGVGMMPHVRPPR